MKYLYKSIILAIVAPDTIIGTSEVHPHGAGGGSSSVSVERIGVPFPLNAFRAMCGELNYRLDPDMDLPNRDMIRAYFIGAGYGRRGDGNLLTFDQNCEMLLGGRIRWNTFSSMPAWMAMRMRSRPLCMHILLRIYQRWMAKERQRQCTIVTSVGLTVSVNHGRIISLVGSWRRE